MLEFHHARPKEDIGSRYQYDGWYYKEIVIPLGIPHETQLQELLELSKHNRFSSFLHNVLERFQDDTQVIQILHRKLMELIADAPGDYYTIQRTPFSECFKALQGSMSKEQAHEAMLATAECNVHVFFDVWSVLERYPSEHLVEVMEVISSFHGIIPMVDQELHSSLPKWAAGSNFQAWQYDPVKLIVMNSAKKDLDLASLYDNELAAGVESAELLLTETEERRNNIFKIKEVLSSILGEGRPVSMQEELAELLQPFKSRSEMLLMDVINGYVRDNGKLCQITEKLIDSPHCLHQLKTALQKSLMTKPLCFPGVIEYVYQRSKGGFDELAQATATINEILGGEKSQLT